MATLNNADYTWIKHWARNRPEIWNELKAWSLPKATWTAALQATETYMVTGFGTRPGTSIRAAIEAETGATTSIRAQYLWVAWVAWKMHNYLGSL
jgi:hypothetical protein